jgi:hypothetical protein
VTKLPTHRLSDSRDTNKKGLKLRVQGRPVNFGELSNGILIEIGA